MKNIKRNFFGLALPVFIVTISLYLAGKETHAWHMGLFMQFVIIIVQSIATFILSSYLLLKWFANGKFKDFWSP